DYYCMIWHDNGWLF
nr:immunoglobulin light chain junction region [Macaca mulatta]